MEQLILSAIIIVSYLTGCNPSYKVDASNVVYKDFDFSTMIPKSPQKSNISHPLVRISGDELWLKVVFEYDDSTKRVVELHKISQNTWRSNHSVAEDNGQVYYFESIYNEGNIYTFEYQIKSSKQLILEAFTMMQPSNNSYSIYNFENKIISKEIMEHPWDFNIENAKRIEKHKWEIFDEKSFLKTYSDVVKDENDIEQIGVSNNNCWELNGHPYNFFNFFTWKYKQTSCF